MKTSILLTLLFISVAYNALAQTTCVAPVITEVKGSGTYCPGLEVTLEVTGTLNNATEWTWSLDSCSGTIVGTGTSLKVNVNKSLTYYVRGTGGCVGVTAICTTAEVKLDDIGPAIISSPKDTVVSNTQGECGAIVMFEVPKGEDSCSDTVYVKRIAGLDPGSFFPVGVTEVKYELSDTLGNKAFVDFNVTVEDEEKPVITCPGDTVVNNETGKCGAIVTYQVPEGSDNCPDVVTKLTEGLGSGAFFPVGITVEKYTVTDASGNVDSCSFTITVKDVELPVINVKKKETTFWPPNHKHHTVLIADYIESVSDNCGGITVEDVVIDEVGSDEPNNGTGDGNTIDDILISSDCDTLQLLAERSGNGNGRVYVITMAVMDLHGNIGTAKFNVEVPHDKGKKGAAKLDSIVYVKNGCDLKFEQETSVVVNPQIVDTDTETSQSTEQDIESSNGEKDKAIVFPNPVNGSFTLKFIAKANDHVKVELYNIIGMKVALLHEQDVEKNKSYNWKMDISSQNSAEYILMIRGIQTRHLVRLIRKE